MTAAAKPAAALDAYYAARDAIAACPGCQEASA